MDKRLCTAALAFALGGLAFADGPDTADAVIEEKNKSAGTRDDFHLETDGKILDFNVFGAGAESIGPSGRSAHVTGLDIGAMKDFRYGIKVQGAKNTKGYWTEGGAEREKFSVVIHKVVYNPVGPDIFATADFLNDTGIDGMEFGNLGYAWVDDAFDVYTDPTPSLTSLPGFTLNDGDAHSVGGLGSGVAGQVLLMAYDETGDAGDRSISMVAAAPEPASLAVLGAGLAALAGARKRARKT